MANEPAKKIAEVKEVSDPAPSVGMRYPKDDRVVREDVLEEMDREFEEYLSQEKEKLLKFSPIKNAKALIVLDYISESGVLYPRRKWGFMMPPTKAEAYHVAVLKRCPQCGIKPRVDSAVQGTCGKCNFDIKPIGIMLVKKYAKEIEQHEKKLREFKSSK